jgi:D-alanine--poly(phosphoribitol) ligase subunit 2
MSPDSWSLGPHRTSPEGDGRGAGHVLASRHDPHSVASTLTAFVNASIMARGRPIRQGDNLQAAGVDSMGLLKLLLFVEAEFGFWMPDEDLVEENISSARALASYICRR